MFSPSNDIIFPTDLNGLTMNITVAGSLPWYIHEWAHVVYPGQKYLNCVCLFLGKFKKLNFSHYGFQICSWSHGDGRQSWIFFTTWLVSLFWKSYTTMQQIDWHLWYQGKEWKISCLSRKNSDLTPLSIVPFHFVSEVALTGSWQTTLTKKFPEWSQTMIIYFFRQGWQDSVFYKTVFTTRQTEDLERETRDRLHFISALLVYSRRLKPI